MLSVDDARARMLADVAPLASEAIPLEQAFGRTLATPLIAVRDQPPFNASAMDGYAFLSAAAPRDLEIVGESAAGRVFLRALTQGEAVRISTGAPLPPGADSVLIQEEATRVGDRLVAAFAQPHRHIRPRGGDFKAGALLLESGRVLDPIAVALAASAGFATLDVVRKPRVAIIAGGDEVVAPGSAAGADQVFESGSFAVAGLARRWGANAMRAQSLPDDEAAIADAVTALLGATDLVVLIGGASVGPHDHARAAMDRLGLEQSVDKVAVRPGKPTWFASSARGRVLGLPGNPASAIVCATLFLRPMIEAMLGRDPASWARPQQAPLATPLDANGSRESYLRARLDAEGRLHPFEDQDSSLLSVFAQANALVLRPPSAGPLQAGANAPYLALD